MFNGNQKQGNKNAKMDAVKEETSPVNNPATEEVVENVEGKEPNSFTEIFHALMQEIGLSIRNIPNVHGMFAPVSEGQSIDMCLSIEQIVDLFNEMSNSKKKIKTTDVEEILLQDGIKGQINDFGFCYGVKVTGGYGAYEAVKRFIVTSHRPVPTSEKEVDIEAKELAKNFLASAVEALEKQNKFYDSMVKYFDKQNKAKA